MLTEIGLTRVWSVGKSTGDALRNLTCRMNIAKFSAIRKRKCHPHYWTNTGNENNRRLYIHIGLSSWWIESFSFCDRINFVVFIDCDGYNMFVVVLFSIPSTAGFQDFHKQSSRSIFPPSSSSTPIASALIPMLWSCFTWSFMVTTSGVTTIEYLRNSVSLQCVD